MSFILDALKKSEAERQRQAGPALLEMRIVRPARRLPAWAVVAGVLLLACVLLLAWIALRRGAGAGGGGAGAAPAVAAAPAGTIAAPGAANAGAGANATAVGVGSAGGVTAAGVPAATGIAAPGAAPGVTVAPLASAPAAVAAPATAGSSVQQAASAGEENPADAEPAEAPAASTLRERADTRGLRNYAELGGTMPELRLDLHVYAAKPADRYAFINMHKVREGEVTPEGMEVKEITPEGVVLDYHGTEFLLGR